jgi:hypothetical protein
MSLLQDVVMQSNEKELIIFYSFKNKLKILLLVHL